MNSERRIMNDSMEVHFHDLYNFNIIDTDSLPITKSWCTHVQTEMSTHSIDHLIISWNSYYSKYSQIEKSLHVWLMDSSGRQPIIHCCLSKSKRLEKTWKNTQGWKVKEPRKEQRGPTAGSCTAFAPVRGAAANETVRWEQLAMWDPSGKDSGGS